MGRDRKATVGARQVMMESEFSATIQAEIRRQVSGHPATLHRGKQTFAFRRDETKTNKQTK